MAESNGDLNATTGPPANPLSLTDRVRSLRLPDRPARRGGGGVLPWILCVLLAGSTGYFAWVAYGEGVELADGKAPAGKDDPIKGEANKGKVNKSSSGIATVSKGYLVPISLIQVSPKVGGMVVKLNIQEGMYVRKDFVLAQLEEVEFKSDYDRVKAQAEQARFRWQELWKYRTDEIRQAQAELDDTKAQRDQLFREYKRSADLRNTGGVSPKEFEQAEFSYKSMDHRMEKLRLTLELLKKGPRDERIDCAKAEMDQWNAEAAKAKWKYDNCTVKAPVAGIILSKKAEEGNMVNPSAFSNGLSASLCEMADLYEMEVDLRIPERDIAKVFEGQECKVQAEAFMDRVYQGKVSRIMPMADRGNGSVPTRVKIDIPRDRERQGEYLRPEMGAVVTFFERK
jgi:multidrug resistance efflux pump